MKRLRPNDEKPVDDDEIRECCPVCKGTGGSACKECDGEGETECDLGHMHECDECDGMAVAECKTCKGRGCLVTARGDDEAEAWKRAPKAVRDALLAVAWQTAAQDGPAGGRYVPVEHQVSVWVGVRLRATKTQDATLKAAGLVRTKWQNAMRPGVAEYVWMPAGSGGSWVGDAERMAPRVTPTATAPESATVAV